MEYYKKGEERKGTIIRELISRSRPVMRKSDGGTRAKRISPVTTTTAGWLAGWLGDGLWLSSLSRGRVTRTVGL